MPCPSTRSLRAQCTKYNMQALVRLCLPIAQGTDSTNTPHRRHCTRRMAYSSITA